MGHRFSTGPESTNGNTNIITAVDYATKLPIAKAVPNRDAVTVAKFIFEEITCRYGAPLEIVSDRATCFLASTVQEYLEILKIHHLPSTPYHPQTNGAVERMHRPLMEIIVKRCQGNLSRWEEYIPQAILALSARKHTSTGFSPFYLCHGLEPRLPPDINPEENPFTPPFLDLKNPEDVAIYQSLQLDELGQHRAAALRRLKAQAIRMKDRYDRSSHVTNRQYAIGDYVKLLNNRKTKLELNWTGPYYVVEIGINDTYYLMKPNGQRLDSAVSSDQMRTYTVDDINEFYAGGRNARLQNLEEGGDVTSTTPQALLSQSRSLDTALYSIKMITSYINPLDLL
jgi:transposase InsO family protein